MACSFTVACSATHMILIIPSFIYGLKMLCDEILKCNLFGCIFIFTDNFHLHIKKIVLQFAEHTSTS